MPLEGIDPRQSGMGYVFILLGSRLGSLLEGSGYTTMHWLDPCCPEAVRRPGDSSCEGDSLRLDPAQEECEYMHYMAGDLMAGLISACRGLIRSCYLFEQLAKPMDVHLE